jgi:hypothetical protein
MGTTLGDRFVRIAVKDADSNRRMASIIRAVFGRLWHSLTPDEP